jgi:arginine utilization protein RocB
MYNVSGEEIKKILLRLVKCSSLSGTSEEIEMAKEVYSILSEMPYFQQNPDYLRLNQIDGDPLGRYFVTAFVKGKGNKTIIFINHYDIVDYEGYGAYKDIALDPERLSKELKVDALPEEAAEDLISGEYIFGRGTADMKCGAAIQMAFIKEVSKDPASFNGNILFVSVCDEENNSAGMIGAVPFINKLKEEFDLEYVAVINSEPHEFKNGLHELFIGAIGKVLPIFYCVGKEAHAGHLLDGFSADLLLSEVSREMELNMELVDGADGENTMPPTVLKLGDMKEQYNVSTIGAAYAYYNVFTLKRSPEEVINILRSISERAFNNALNKFKQTVILYKELTGIEFPCPWEVKVFTYDEIYRYNLNRLGESFKTHMDKFIEDAKGLKLDEREFAVKVISEVCNLCPDKDPKIVIGFAPPYYPHFRNKGESEKEKNLLNCIEKLRRYSKENFGVEWKVSKFHKGISDMSYCGLQDADKVIKMLKPNMPTLGYTYQIPLEKLAKLNVPVLNIGPWGKDIHMFTERMHASFAFEVVPKLIAFTVETLLQEDK